MTRLYVLLLFVSFAVFADTTRVGNNTALVIIDMQDYFVNRGGFSDVPDNVRKAREVIDRQIELIRAARAQKIPIIFIEWENWGATNSRLKQAVAGYAKTKTFPKTADGMFDQSNVHLNELSEYLRGNEIGNLVITGANGGACVQDSISGAITNNYNVIAYEDGIADFNFQDFVYPYVNRYTEFRTPKCASCNFTEVTDPATMTMLLSQSRRHRASEAVNDSDRATPRADLPSSRPTGIREATQTTPE